MDIFLFTKEAIHFVAVTLQAQHVNFVTSSIFFSGSEHCGSVGLGFTVIGLNNLHQQFNIFMHSDLNGIFIRMEESKPREIPAAHPAAAGQGAPTSRKGKRKPPRNPIKLRPCEVCGAKASGIHFGAITCEACKVKMLIIMSFFGILFIRLTH